MNKELDRYGAEKHYKILLLFLVALLLIVPAVVFLVSDNENKNTEVEYLDETGSATGDMSMDSSSRNAWESYLDSAPTLKFDFRGPSSDILEETPDIDEYLPDINESDVEYKESDIDTEDRSGDYSETPPGEKADQSNDDDLDSGEGSGGEREVEESDIVKAIGDRLYVLNSYRGLMVVNLEDAEDPYVEGSVQVLGNPISMYVVDFLGFVIVSRAPTLDGTGQYSGMMYIMDLTDNSDPRIVHMVELTGYPVDSRRVGEVIYVISNEYEYYHYHDDFAGRAVLETDGEDDVVHDEEPTDENGPKTHVTSIGFYDPSEIGQRDKVTIDGNAGLVHASSFAIYIPQPNNDYRDPETDFTYVDISDPEGDINVRGKITVPGLLIDRYQMDHYKGTFRVVTQKWPAGDRWGELPMSTLYVIDARNPDRMKRISSLLIDDSGNLMATRFAGERAYTIHLPRTIDPLDVIDLSDPTDPELTDILELPGWVEHMEVIGKDIIAVGVDDSDGWKVALSLFDVNDPYNAVLDDRITIGEGYTYSSANYDPKALTILEERELVLIPFDSYDWRSYGGSVHGLQVVSFDLEEGDLEEVGTVISDDSVQRTRWVNGAVVTMSQRMVMTVDVDGSEPEVLGRVELTSNVIDAFLSDDMIVSLIRPYWGESGATIRVSDPDTPYTPVKVVEIEGLEHIQFLRDEDRIYVKGINQEGDVPVSEVHVYDFSDPLSPSRLDPARVPVPESYYSYEYYDEKYILEDDVEIEDDGNESVRNEPEIRLWYDPFSWQVLDDGSVAIHITEYDYRSEGYESRSTIHLISWSETGDNSMDSIVLNREDDHITDIVGNKDRILVSTQDWWPPSTRLTEIGKSEGSLSIIRNHQITGSFLGASEDLSKVYTSASFREEEESHHKLNVFSLGETGAVLFQSMEVGSPVSTAWFTGDSIVVVSQSWDYWWGPYYGGIRYDDDVAYSENAEGGSGDEEGQSSGATPGGDPDDNEKEDVKEEVAEGTKIIHIDLEEALFGDVASLQLSANVYVSYNSDEMVVLDSGMTHTVVSFTDGLEEEGSWFGNGWVQGGDIEEGLLVLAMGMYGIEVKDI